MNSLALISGLLLLVFYFFLYIRRVNYPWMSATGLLLMTFSMVIDGVPSVYVVLTGFSALFVIYGAIRPP